MDIARLTKVDATTWRIEPHGAMRVPAIIYADESLLRDIDDKVYEQAANVATLPGIVGAFSPVMTCNCFMMSRTTPVR